jgi:hypothetical protein
MGEEREEYKGKETDRKIPGGFLTGIGLVHK